jgi:hypothetical protein
VRHYIETESVKGKFFTINNAVFRVQIVIRTPPFGWDLTVWKALAALLGAGKLAKLHADEVKPEEQDLVLVSGGGSAYPLQRWLTRCYILRIVYR